MSSLASNFVGAYLGRAALLPPSLAVAEALRHHLLTDDLKNPLDTGAQSSPRNVPGKWPDAYAVFHGTVTPQEMAPRWDKWIEMESLRGLPDGPLLPKTTNVYEVQHFTVTQHWLIGALHPDPAQAKLSRAQALALRALVLADGVITNPLWKGASRAPGWVGQGLSLDNLATKDAGVLSSGLAPLVSKIAAAHGELLDVPGLGNVPQLFPNQAPAILLNVNHLFPNSPWMDSTCGDWLATWSSPGGGLSHDLLLHWLRCVNFAQRPDGTFHDDYGIGIDGTFGYHEAPGESTETFIWPALVHAKEALDDDWPAWAQLLLDRCKGRWLALNRFKPGDSGFRDAHNQAIAIAVAPEWGLRE